MKICSKCKIEKEKVEFGKDKYKSDGLTSKCLKCINLYYEINKVNSKFLKRKREATKKSHRKLSSTPKYREYQNNYRLNRYELDEEYRTKCIERSSNWRSNARKNSPEIRAIDNCRRRVSSFIKRSDEKFSKEIGCTVKQFKVHIESKFTEGMTWENYGEWQIDHIFPLSIAFKLGPEKFAESCKYTNLQPLWASDNKSKGNKAILNEDEEL